MGKNHAQAYNAEKKTDLLYFKPESLRIIDDPSHPLYDARVKLPVDEALVESIMLDGVIQPITVRKAGEDEKGQPIIEVMVGRQRVRAAVEANKRLSKKGEPLVLVPAVTKRGEDKDLFRIGRSENAIRRNDSLLESARAAQRMRDRFASTDEELRIAFGVSPATIRNWKLLLELAPSVQRAVEQQVVPMAAALTLHKLDHLKQKTALQKMIDTGATRGKAARESARASKEGRSTRKVLDGRKKIRSADLEEALERFREHSEYTDLSSDVALAGRVVAFLLGDKEALDAYDTVRDLLDPSPEE